MKASYLRNVGRNRGVARVWLEGEMLLSNGWNNGDRFNVTFLKGALIYEKNPAGKRKVAGTPDRPILDTNTAKLAKVCGFSTGDKLPVTVTPDKVTVGEAVSLDKVREAVSATLTSADILALIEGEIRSIRRSGMLDRGVRYSPRLHYTLALQHGERCDPYEDPIDYPEEPENVTVESLQKHFEDHPLADSLMIQGGFDSKDRGEWEEWEPVYGLEWAVEIKRGEV